MWNEFRTSIQSSSLTFIGFINVAFTQLSTQHTYSHNKPISLEPMQVLISNTTSKAKKVFRKITQLY